MKARNNNSNAFGRRLRAARMRFGHSERHQAFIRLTPIAEGRTRVELVPDSMLVPNDKPDTCDAPMCHACAISIRPIDMDFCRDCVKAEPHECACGPTPEHPCRGPTVGKDRCCLAHSLLFTRWLQAHGGAEVYADASKSRDEKRRVFRFWLARFPANSARGVFAVAGWRVD